MAASGYGFVINMTGGLLFYSAMFPVVSSDLLIYIQLI
jgi:hypothetical protein